MKYNKRIMIVLLMTITFLLGINNVSALSCADEPYQCITCHYTLDGDSGSDYYGTKLRITVNSDKNKTPTIVSSALSDDLYNLDVSNLKANSFILNGKLGCPTLSVNPDARIGTTSIKVYANEEYFKATLNSDLTEDNHKSFGSSSASSPLTCTGIEINSSNDNNLSEEDDMRGVNKAEETATISVSGESVTIINTDSRYKLDSDYLRGISAKDFENGCPNDLTLHCIASEGSMNSCYLKRYSDYNDNYIYAGTSLPINCTDTSGDSSYQYEKYVVKCSDVKHLTRAWFLIQLLAPFLLIIFTAYDYIRVVMAGNEEEMKKIKKNTPKRLIAFILLLFTPFIVKFIINNFGQQGAENTSMLKCIVNGDLGENDDEYTPDGSGKEATESIVNSAKCLHERLKHNLESIN